MCESVGVHGYVCSNCQTLPIEDAYVENVIEILAILVVLGYLHGGIFWLKVTMSVYVTPQTRNVPFRGMVAFSNHSAEW